MSDSEDGIYVRNLEVKDEEACVFLEAHFHRFVSPLNYILTPKTDLHTIKLKVKNSDIAESIELQRYTINRFKEIYGVLYF